MRGGDAVAVAHGGDVDLDARPAQDVDDDQALAFLEAVREEEERSCHGANLRSSGVSHRITVAAWRKAHGPLGGRPYNPPDRPDEGEGIG